MTRALWTITYPIDLTDWMPIIGKRELRLVLCDSMGEVHTYIVEVYT